MTTASKKQVVTETIVLEMSSKEAQTLRDVLGYTANGVIDALGLMDIFVVLEKIFPIRASNAGYAIKK